MRLAGGPVIAAGFLRSRFPTLATVFGLMSEIHDFRIFRKI